MLGPEFEKIKSGNGPVAKGVITTIHDDHHGAPQVKAINDEGMSSRSISDEEVQK